VFVAALEVRPALPVCVACLRESVVAADRNRWRRGGNPRARGIRLSEKQDLDGRASRKPAGRRSWPNGTEVPRMIETITTGEQLGLL